MLERLEGSATSQAATHLLLLHAPWPWPWPWPALALPPCPLPPGLHSGTRYVTCNRDARVGNWLDPQSCGTPASPASSDPGQALTRAAWETCCQPPPPFPAPGEVRQRRRPRSCGSCVYSRVRQSAPMQGFLYPQCTCSKVLQAQYWLLLKCVLTIFLS